MTYCLCNDADYCNFEPLALQLRTKTRSPVPVSWIESFGSIDPINRINHLLIRSNQLAQSNQMRSIGKIKLINGINRSNQTILSNHYYFHLIISFINQIKSFHQAFNSYQINQINRFNWSNQAVAFNEDQWVSVHSSEVQPQLAPPGARMPNPVFLAPPISSIKYLIFNKWIINLIFINHLKFIK